MVLLKSTAWRAERAGRLMEARKEDNAMTVVQTTHESDGLYRTVDSSQSRYKFCYMPLFNPFLHASSFAFIYFFLSPLIGPMFFRISIPPIALQSTRLANYFVRPPHSLSRMISLCF
jgi:hypothetical protein